MSHKQVEQRQAQNSHRKLVTINGLAPCACPMGEVSTLQHEVGNDSVESAALICQLLAFLPHALLSSTKCSEIFRGFRNDIPIQTKGDTT